ncbi:MAG TPA: serine/threonine-protein kinase [Polyangiaceae bacterium]|nr:serine/threonine-protein kinase [Polyangiaceae bacterium]
MSASLAIPDGTRFAPGTIVGNKYRIDGCLGEGGMGVVLSATHLELDAPVAIKVVREEFAGSQEMVERVLFEARAVARMRSNHVVRVLDVARLDSGCPYIVMEQLQGEDLGLALWEKGPFSAPQAIDYLLQACDGLAEAHSLGIVHRDLKPGNLFLANTPEGVVLKVLDFGISKEVSTPLRSVSRISRTSLTSAGDPVGSPYYMAPEQMRASPDVDARADIWSLGAILFELLTGQCPFEGDTLTEVCGKVLAEAPPSLAAFTDGAATELDSVIARCLEKDPNLRYQNVGELSHALRAWRPSEDVELPEPEPKRRFSRSARLPLAMVGLSTLLVLGGVGLWQTHGSAASLETQRVRPMIAAAATPIWQAFPEPPKVEPTAVASHVRPKTAHFTYPSAFRNAVVKEHSPDLEPAAVTTSEALSEAPMTSATETTESVTNPPPADPVSGRYGL